MFEEHARAAVEPVLGSCSIGGAGDGVRPGEGGRDGSGAVVADACGRRAGVEGSRLGRAGAAARARLYLRSEDQGEVRCPVRGRRASGAGAVRASLRPGRKVETPSLRLTAYARPEPRRTRTEIECRTN